MPRKPRVRKEEQIGLDDEWLTNAENGPELLGKLNDWAEADAKWGELSDQRTTVKAAEKTRNEAKAAVLRLMPLDEKPHQWRLDRYIINAQPPSPPSQATRTPKHRVRISTDGNGDKR